MRRKIFAALCALALATVTIPTSEIFLCSVAVGAIILAGLIGISRFSMHQDDASMVEDRTTPPIIPWLIFMTTGVIDGRAVLILRVRSPTIGS